MEKRGQIKKKKTIAGLKGTRLRVTPSSSLATSGTGRFKSRYQLEHTHTYLHPYKHYTKHADTNTYYYYIKRNKSSVLEHIDYYYYY